MLVRSGASVNNGRVFKSSFAENIPAGFYAVAVTSRQKNLCKAISTIDGMVRRVVHYLYNEEQTNVWCE